MTHQIGLRRSWLRALLRIRDDRGITLVMTAVTISALLAVTGLAVDAGWWYTVRWQNQSAADAAALSAAYEALNGKCSTSACMTPFATAAAGQNAYTGSTPTVTYPFNNDNTLVQAVLSKNENTLFAAMGGLNSVTIEDSAVAQITVLDSPCSYVVNPGADKALSVTGSATLSTPTCSVCVASNKSDSVYLQGGQNAVLNADTLITAGQISTTGQPQLNTNHPPQVGAPASLCADPYTNLTHAFLTQGMPTAPCPAGVNPPTSGNCVYTNTANGNKATLTGNSITLQPNMVFEGGLNVKGQTINLSPGTYWIADGDFNLLSGSTLECTGCAAGGAGVTIILTTTQTSNGTVGNISEQSNAVIDSLNAPGSGTFDNLLLIQDSNSLPSGTTYTPAGTACAASSSTFQGTTSATFTGLVYFPCSNLNFQGNPAVGQYSCLLMVANTLTLQGNPTDLTTTGCPTSGPGGLHQIKTVALVQ